jgi:hypothetical protein
MGENTIPQVNNSKKISQLRGRDAITYHQDHSWIAVAQYNSLIGSYHNIAMNISAITSYAIESSVGNATTLLNDKIQELIDTYYLSYTAQLGYFVGEYDYEQLSYMIEPQSFTYNIMAYASQFAQNQIMWDYYPSNEFVNVKIDYLITDDNEFILTDKGKKLRVE